MSAQTAILCLAMFTLFCMLFQSVIMYFGFRHMSNLLAEKERHRLDIAEAMEFFKDGL